MTPSRSTCAASRRCSRRTPSPGTATSCGGWSPARTPTCNVSSTGSWRPRASGAPPAPSRCRPRSSSASCRWCGRRRRNASREQAGWWRLSPGARRGRQRRGLRPVCARLAQGARIPRRDSILRGDTMSVFEPHTEPDSDGASQLPALDVPLRGRKGQQVTAYIQELAARLDQQRVRAEQAERAAAHLKRELEALRNQPPPSFEHLGSEAARVLEEAGRSAKVLVEEAKDRGKDAVKKAQDAAERVRASADHDAETRLDAARQAPEQMLAKANGERAAVETETKRLRQYRDGLLGHLGRVQTDLAGFLSEVSDPPAVPSPAAAGTRTPLAPASPGGAPAPGSAPAAAAPAGAPTAAAAAAPVTPAPRAPAGQLGPAS